MSVAAKPPSSSAAPDPTTLSGIPVKREYDALAPEFEALAESIRTNLAKKSQRKASRRVLKRDPDLAAEN